MVKYGEHITMLQPEKLELLNIDRQSSALVPNGTRVLEIGCATGFLGNYLIKKKYCQVIGVELGKEEGKIAAKYLQKVVHGDIEDVRTIAQIKKLGKFDVVYASALIEHLKDPWKALRTWRSFLKRDGQLIITTSNIAHWSMRLKMLRGDFTYQKYGILDNTHLRFFTTKTFPQLVEDTGFSMTYFSIDPVGGGYPRISRFLSKFFPNMFAYQMLIQAKCT